ncbi:MAG: 16S rRNA processing protein RimM [Acidimicrobiia bacterium]|nr:16S rRNA processing protein RimM [Acidimicrobiia bacterium]
MSQGGPWLTLARVSRARGRAGEVVVVSYADSLETFESAGEVSLFGRGLPAEGAVFRIENAWLHQGKTVLKLAGIDSISDAEALRGAEIRQRRETMAPPEEGEFYLADLVGCRVEDVETGEEIGKVEDWMQGGAATLLKVVSAAGEEILVPFAKAICVEIDPKAGLIQVRLPEGLRELNRK